MPEVPAITVILNAASGHHDADEAAREIQAGFDEAGCGCRLVVAQGAEEVERRAREVVDRARARKDAEIPPGAGAQDASADSPTAQTVLVAAGGDGTINLLAGIALEGGVAFGVIPLGTFNYLARDLGIPLQPREAARALASGVFRRIHVGHVNEHLFLNNASFGLYRQLLEEREGFKQRFGRYKAVAVLAALATLWRHRRSYTLRMDIDGRPAALNTAMLFFGLNSLQFENLGMDAARCTQAGLMAVIVLGPTSRWRLLALALRGALHRLNDSPDLRSHCALTAEVLLPGRRRVRVAVDGESVECALPLKVRVQRDALAVLVPREPEERK